MIGNLFWKYLLIKVEFFGSFVCFIFLYMVILVGFLLIRIRILLVVKIEKM